MSGKKIKWPTIARESALTNQNVGLAYKYASIRWENKATSGRSI